jgi:hypothetical protein
MSEEDPRDIVTDYAFRVSPVLLGAALASPRRRGAALLIDGMIVAVLANAPSVIFGLATALVLLRAAVRPPSGGVIRRSVRRATRFVAGVILFVVSISLWDVVADFGSDDEPPPVQGDDVVALTGLRGIAAGREMVGFIRSVEAEDEAEARRRLGRAAQELEEAGISRNQVVEILREIPESVEGGPWLQAAVDSLILTLGAGIATGPAPDTEREADLMEAYSVAAAAEDSAAMRDARSELARVLARDTVTALEEELSGENARVASLSADVRELEEQLEEGGGLLAGLVSLLEDLGLEFGWTSLYFTSFVALWRGQTPGKRLLGLRIVRLDNKPIGWWNAFERFAGYAAGLATGLLGFFQIFWDRNRQGIQDKIAATVVVRE